LLLLFDGSATAPLGAWQGDWRRYWAWLYALCLRRRVNRTEAADVVQEVFAALSGFARFRRGHPGAPLRPWMFRVLVNKIADMERDRARRPEAVVDERLDTLAPRREAASDPAACAEPLATALAPILDRVRRRCAEPNNWLAFRAMVFDGKSAGEAAAELGMTKPQVHTAKARVLRRLREEIGVEAASLQAEFNPRTWEIFQAVAVEGDSPETLATRFGASSSEVRTAVVQVLSRVRESLRGRAS
jgi:RNA polymerase sigma factor (sigma-70 family)